MFYICSIGLQTVSVMWEPEGTFLFLSSCILWVRLPFAAIIDEAWGPLGASSEARIHRLCDRCCSVMSNDVTSIKDMVLGDCGVEKIPVA